MFLLHVSATHMAIVRYVHNMRGRNTQRCAVCVFSHAYVYLLTVPVAARSKA
jgi:hypothetical protein